MMADRNLSVMAFMFLMEASSLVLTSSWDIACSGVTSYGSLLLRTGQKEKENMRPSSLSGALRESFKLLKPWCPLIMKTLFENTSYNLYFSASAADGHLK